MSPARCHHSTKQSTGSIFKLWVLLQSVGLAKCDFNPGIRVDEPKDGKLFYRLLPSIGFHPHKFLLELTYF